MLPVCSRAPHLPSGPVEALDTVKGELLLEQRDGLQIYNDLNDHIEDQGQSFRSDRCPVRDH